MDYMTENQASKESHISKRRVQLLCSEEGFPEFFNLEKPGPFQRIQINQKIKDGRMKVLEPTAIDLFADAADFL